MTKEELIKLLNENLWVSGQTDNSQTVMGVERAAEKIATKFFLMEAEIERLRKANVDMGWQLNPDRMGGQFTREETERNWEGWR